MAKSATLTVSVSTNPTFSERYFCNLRVGARQTVRYRDSAGVLEFLLNARKAGAPHGVAVEFIDATTGELSEIS